MPATIPAKAVTSCLNLYTDDLHPVTHFWDCVIGEYGMGNTYRSVVDAVLYAREHKMPIRIITRSRDNFRHVERLLEQHGVTLVTEGAEETVSKNYR